ncbi:MAG: glycosyltransferase family 4 protein [Alphaproteobacteria bacterium]|nr:glycosyltransferase family 4 protein [Alphaproteobacteria bacterium]
MTSIPDKQVAAGHVAAGARRRFCVLQVLPALETGGGGVERSTLDVASALARAGHRSLVASAGGPMAHEVTRAGAEHIELPLAAKNPFTMRANVARLAAKIKKHGVDIVHARSRAPAWSAHAAARRTRTHFLTTFHGTYNYSANFSGALKHKYNAVMTKGELVIANSQFIADHVRTHYHVDEGSIRVIPRGIDLGLFDPVALRPDQVPEITKQWHLADDVPTIMLPGRLTRWKGHELLIDALAEIRLRPLACLLVGADQGREKYRRRLEARIVDKGLEGVVRLVGHCDDMPAAYMLADVVVSASTDPEAFGRVVAEAQAMGRPVVVAGHGGAAEQIVDGVTGWLFEPGSASDLAAKLTRALGLDVAARDRLALEAAAYVRERYGKERMCAATLAVYDELMGR